LFLPLRQQSRQFAAETTFRPTIRLLLQRGAIEFVRVVLPGTCFVVLISALSGFGVYFFSDLTRALGQGIIVCFVALLLRAPEAGEVAVPAAPAVQQTRRDYTPTEVLKTPVFYVMYAMFVMVGAGGLMAIAQLAPRGVHQTKVVDHDQLYAVTPNVEPGAGKQFLNLQGGPVVYEDGTIGDLGRGL